MSSARKHTDTHTTRYVDFNIVLSGRIWPVEHLHVVSLELISDYLFSRILMMHVAIESAFCDCKRNVCRDRSIIDGVGNTNSNGIEHGSL